MPKAPGNRLAGQPVPKHVTAAEPEIPWLAKSKQKWTTPLPVSTVRGLQARTVLPPAKIQPTARPLRAMSADAGHLGRGSSGSR